jgi:hypothetical protein
MAQLARMAAFEPESLPQVMSALFETPYLFERLDPGRFIDVSPLTVTVVEMT